MTLESGYPVPAETVWASQEIKRSRFIGAVGRAADREAAMAFIDAVREKYPDAGHHCWAFIAGPPDGASEMGASDDGEPSGTAGKPMLNVLQHKHIGEIVAVVVRYFGGVKLGTGGLVRAYAGAVQAAVEKLPLMPLVPLRTIRISVSYAHESQVRRLLEAENAEITGAAYSDRVTHTVVFPAAAEAGILRMIADQTRGQADITPVDAVP